MVFQERVATEEACWEYLFACRWPDRFCCRRCGGGEVGGMQQGRAVWQCKVCGLQSWVNAGTVTHKTHMPLRVWFWAAYLVATHHPGISAVQLLRQLGIPTHETAWMMLHKRRWAMVAPEREPLKGEVEVDECFLGGFEEGKRGGRKLGKKTLAGVAIEVRGRGSGRLRLAVLRDASADSLDALIKATIAPGIVHTDGWHGYDQSQRRATSTIATSGAPRPASCWCPAHTEPSPTSRRGCTAPTAQASSDHLPAYLDEFVFRHNRRGNPHAAFQTLLGLSAHHGPEHLPRDHRPRRLTPNGTNPVCTCRQNGVVSTGRSEPPWVSRRRC
jgi:hypothetical protein